jgi:hypothetical protein
VSEYWLLDPRRRDAAFFQLDPNGYYQPVLAGASGVYRSKLWQEPLDPISVLFQIAPETYSQYLEAARQQAARRER